MRKIVHVDLPSTQITADERRFTCFFVSILLDYSFYNKQGHPNSVTPHPIFFYIQLYIYILYTQREEREREREIRLVLWSMFK